MNYYIQGDAAKAEQIKAAFEAKGCVMHTGMQCDLSDMVYFSLNGKVGGIKLRNLELFKTHPDYQELELPKPHYDIANFHAGMPVLVRIDNSHMWSYTLFSHYNKGWNYPFSVASCCNIKQCIPYEGNEHLLGTTDPCGEEYINW